MMWTRKFWLDAVERAVKTAAQTAAALIGVDVATSVVSIDWPYVAGVAATAAVLSVLTSIGSKPVGEPGSASLVRGGA